MREGTSGFWIEESQEALSIGYEDYGVSQFGGGSFECTYTMKNENAEKFKQFLARRYDGTLEQMVEAAFGKNFNDNLFKSFCNSNNIEYTVSTWVSGD